MAIDLDEIFNEVDSLAQSKDDLVQWVVGKLNDWEAYYDTNYRTRHEAYMRLFRNEYDPADKERESENSKLIAPALSQAVESNVAEVEEATFGRGKIFDIRDDMADQDPKDIAFLRNKLHEDFACTRIRTAVSEVLINAAVYGTGIAELVLDEMTEYVPATQPIMDGAMNEIGVNISNRPVVRLEPVQPKNFLIDPAASCIDDAFGCAIVKPVSRHVVEELQEQGVYRDEYVGDMAEDSDLRFDDTVETSANDRIKLTKYYGKVPYSLLEAADVDLEDVKESHYVEAVIVIGNDGTLLKAIPNPYMCKDRPVVAFQWDIIPNTFWGRGVCEKGYMSQKALDAELRARIDALALTTHPMMAMDATRIPRGSKLEVKPGRTILTNGAPSETIMPFNFGQLNGVTFQQGAVLQQMVAQATGAADGSQVQIQNDVTAAGQSMSQGGILKRQKRTLVNFQENFLIPMVKKSAWRYMQFDPENYPVQDYKFVAYSSLGSMAREYEVAQLTQILQVIPPDAPAHSIVVESIIDHLNISNREQLIEALRQANQPNPEAQKAAQEQQQMEMAIMQGQVQLLNSQAAESQARAQKYSNESKYMPVELALKYSDTDGNGEADGDFDKRIRLGELLIKEQEMQMKQDSETEKAKAKAEAELIRQLTAQAGGSNAEA